MRTRVLEIDMRLRVVGMGGDVQFHGVVGLMVGMRCSQYLQPVDDLNGTVFSFAFQLLILCSQNSSSLQRPYTIGIIESNTFYPFPDSKFGPSSLGRVLTCLTDISHK
jgi:hypothetical protein